MNGSVSHLRRSVEGVPQVKHVSLSEARKQSRSIQLARAQNEVDEKNAEIEVALARVDRLLATPRSDPLTPEAFDDRSKSLRSSVAHLLDAVLSRSTVNEETHSHAQYTEGRTTGVETWLARCLEHDGIKAACHYDESSAQLIVDVDLPPYSDIPHATSFKVSKSPVRTVAVARPDAERRALYTSLIASVGLKAIHTVFVDDTQMHVSAVVLNGYLESVDPSTGNLVRPCLVTVRTDREQFEAFDLTRVDPVACLRRLNASISRDPRELSPVRPIVSYDMFDRRFIEEDDVLSAIDSRTNLMELTPSEFESLITNLFSRMGLETRLTQASSDGGVDCVAFDMRPVIGGKVVIQAKRYSGTVGVSAVRDLYGTVLNEGANKGVLVCTSGYGPGAYRFAANKPLELLSGSNLLALLAEHAGVEARIVPVEQPADSVP